ncbi:hypothetical protein [Phaeobacter sp. 22II1-1F12B]|uniref:hypothetical protein n=1 Tax=Phaeobacter sp. 22II1-1F12B TaxID=1317111 RepID=UPI000B5251E6|nr:hypothetical protein [Phaeobacter sp. 22II1-1F12B]OWU66734.1 hypothetical protein ATO1_25965 [Phaeobacter sp. 22II1-1F12B]
MTDKPQKISFVRKIAQAEAPIRDKDNADLKSKPPSWSRSPAPNLAPPGMTGIKRNLPSSANEQSARPRFVFGDKSKLKKEFKPIATKAKGHDHER